MIRGAGRTASKFRLLFIPLTLGVLATRSVLASAPVPTDVTVLSYENFVGRPYTSVADALEGETSIKIERDGSHGTKTLVKMRGLSSAKNVVVLLDGRPLTVDYDSQVDLSQIPLNIVDRIEITRGGSHVSYTGEAAGGVINIITAHPDRKGLEAQVGTGAGRNGVKHSEGRFTGRSNLGDITYLTGKEESGGFLYNERSLTTHHFGNVKRSFNGKGFWKAEYFYEDSQVGQANGTPIPFSQWNGSIERNPSVSDSVKTQQAQHMKLSFGSPLILGGTAYCDLTQSLRQYDFRAYSDGDSLYNRQSRLSIGNAKWRRGELELGGELQEKDRDIRFVTSNEVHQSAFYVLDQFSYKKLTAKEELRYDHHSRAGGFVTPRIVMLYAANPTTTFSATAQRSHRTPDFDELFYSSTAINNPNLKPESARSYDAGAAWDPSKKFGIKLTGFAIRMTDLIAVNPVTTQYENAGREESEGLETEANFRAGESTRFQNVKLQLRWTLQDGKRSFPWSGEGTSAMVPHQLVFGRFDYYMPRKVMLTNELRYQSEQFELDQKNGVKIPGFYVWNIRLGFKILSADLYVEGRNITGQRYAEALGSYTPPGGTSQTVLSPQPDRTYWTGITILFKD